MIGLDTSVLVRLIVGEPANQCASARELLESALERSEPVLISDLVVGETYYALQHHYGIPKREACALLRQLLESGAVVANPAGMAAVVGLAGNGTGLVDRLIHLRYQDHGATTVTFDAQQGRLTGAIKLGKS